MSPTKKAAGIDAWRPADLARLPQDWFAFLADIWNVVLKSGKVPTAWANVRLVGIPKNDGTSKKRGLGIATYVWRLGLSEVIMQHRARIQSWLHAGIRSGPGRQMDVIIENLVDDLFDAEENDKNALGAKIDIAKFFDRCDIHRSVLILRRRGISKELADVLVDFYRQLRMWVQAAGAVAKTPIRPERCLLQGCPGSMLCAIAEMHVWASVVLYRHPNVDISCFVDDRLLRASGPDAQSLVQAAVETTRQCDHDAGWLWNTKGEVWTSRGDPQNDLGFRPHVGPRTDVASMVGIQVPVNIAAREIPHRDAYYTATRKLAAVVKAEHQCKRIARGTPGRNHRARAKRRRLVAQLVCPELAWGGQWFGPSEAEEARQDRIAEMCINDHVIFRSPALGIISAGARASPGFLRDYAVIRLELSCARRRWRGIRHRDRGSRINQVAARWNWRRTGDFSYATPAGELDLETDGRATIEFAAIDGWKRYVLQRDNRCTAQTPAATALRRPLTEIHEKWAASGKQRERIALGAAMDHRSHEWLQKQIQASGRSFPADCACGDPLPTRRHWMWRCPSVLPAAPAEPADSTSMEHGLGVPMLAYPPASPPINVAPSDRIVAALRAASLHTSEPILVASDGGVQDPTRPRYRSGAFGVAIQPPRGHAVTIKRWVGGMDQTSFAAEVQGALTVLASSVAAGVPVHLIIDNTTVQRGIATRIRGAKPTVQYCGRLWQQAEALCSDLPPNCACSWVLAHGRHTD